MIPLTFLAFTYDLRENTGAIRSVGKAISFMRANKKQTFILGGMFYIGVMIGSSIPFIGILVSAAANLFMYDMMLEIVPQKYEY